MDLTALTAVWLLLLQCSILAQGERIKKKMYSPLDGFSCFRRLNGTHQTGCSSDQFGSVGVLHLVQQEADFDFLLNNPPAPPYAPLIPPRLFKREYLLRLKQAGSKNISVVLLINQPGHDMFSQELKCPNAYSGIMWANSSSSPSCDATRNDEQTWNPWGTGLLHEDFPFPIYYVSDEDEVLKLLDCFEKFNNFGYEGHARRSLCAVEVSTFMLAAVSSEVCMRRTNFVNNLGRTKFCDPLEGRNIFATLFPRSIVEKSNHHVEGEEEETVQQTARKVNAIERFILLTTRLDTTSMFDGMGVGAMDSLLGYATLLNVGHMLTELLPSQNALNNKNLNVLFVIFNGESYDYIGSQRFVYDLEQLAFPTRSTRTAPISFENIEYMLDIGTLDTIDNIKLHTYKSFAHANELLEKLQKYGSKLDFNIKFEKNEGIHLPPTSAQSFLRKNLSFPAMILNAPPSNKFYHSIFDNKKNLNFTYGNKNLSFTSLMDDQQAFKYFPAESVQMKLRNISSVIGMALFETLTGVPYQQTQLVNPLLVDEMLYCFLESANCTLFKAASHPNSLPGLKMPPLRYISVSGGPQESSGWTYRLMGYLLSQAVPSASKEQCNVLPRHWVAGFSGEGECRWGTQNYSYALSPAFLMEDYDWKSGQYSTWTESTWTSFSARIFLKPSRMHELMTLSVGIVILILSFCVVYIISTRSDVLFEDAPSSTDTLNEPTAC